MIVIDTSVVVQSFSGSEDSARALRETLARGERIVFPTLVMYEWLRGPRRPEELAAQEALFPLAEAVPFGPEEAEVSARLYRAVGRARGRDMDIAIAACAISRGALLWTLNRADFEDLPGLRLWDA